MELEINKTNLIISGVLYYRIHNTNNLKQIYLEVSLFDLSIGYKLSKTDDKFLKHYLYTQAISYEPLTGPAKLDFKFGFRVRFKSGSEEFFTDDYEEFLNFTDGLLKYFSRKKNIIQRRDSKGETITNMEQYLLSKNQMPTITTVVKNKRGGSIQVNFGDGEWGDEVYNAFDDVNIESQRVNNKIETQQSLNIEQSKRKSGFYAINQLTIQRSINYEYKYKPIIVVNNYKIESINQFTLIHK